MPFVARAQSETIRIGTLTPLTGAGGSYGPPMVAAMRSVVEEVNAAGGVLGRRVELVTADDETTPDVGVRAARKLIDVNGVVAILGTWASAVTTAVAPLCWQNKVMLFTVSGGDGITRLPHLGYIIRTQPDSNLQSDRAAAFMLTQGARKVFYLSAQTPFAVSIYERHAQALKQGGGEAVGNTIYDATKTSFRSEVDQVMKVKPDSLFLNSYQPDLLVLLRDLFRAGYEGKRFTLGYAANDKLIAALPTEVTDGLVSYAPSPDLDSPAYRQVQAVIGANPDPYSCQSFDHINLTLLAIAKAGAASGPAIHDAVRAVGNPKGEMVTRAVEGLKLLAAGKEVNYVGASGPCKFTDSATSPAASSASTWSRKATRGCSSCPEVPPHPGIPADIVAAAAARRGRPRVYDRIEPARTALVVIDLQRAFMDEGAPSECASARAVVPTVNRLAAALRHAGGVVAWVQASFGARGWPMFFDHMVAPDLSARILRRPSAGIGGARAVAGAGGAPGRPGDAEIPALGVPARSEPAAAGAAGPGSGHRADRRLHDQRVLRQFGPRRRHDRLSDGDGGGRQRRPQRRGARGGAHHLLAGIWRRARERGPHRGMGGRSGGLAGIGRVGHERERPG